MAKKKHSKLNQRIRHYFDGDGFDDGIERVSTATLIELSQSLGMIPDSFEKAQLVKLFRRIWSEGDLDLRNHIVAFFKAENRIYPSPSNAVPSLERSEKISELIGELDVTPEEAKLLHNAYIDVRSKKITVEKMESTLRHIRFEKKKGVLEKALGGIFDLDDRFEFNASFEYTVLGESFKKIHTLKTRRFDYEMLQSESEAVIIEAVEAQKAELSRIKQEQIDAFLKRCAHPKHQYLDDGAILSALKRMPPVWEEGYPELPDTLLQQVIATLHPGVRVSQTPHDVLVTLERTLTLPLTHAALPYELGLTLEKAPLLERIWSEQPLDIAGALADAERVSRDHFEAALSELVFTCKEHSRLLQLDDATLYGFIYDELLPMMGRHLDITPKMVRKVVYAFGKNIQQMLFKRQRSELLARTIRDFKNLFPFARELRRKLILHIGPTNSGKTYTAMERLKKADTGYYLAPLRLLALEGYEELLESGIAASLITGEEQILDEEASHISSTIEMLNFDVDVDVCVIDEVQMIDDRDRGWAWANAIIGAPAKTVIMTGSSNAREAVEALAEYLGEPLEIIEFERKNPLHLLKHATPLAEVPRGSAVIAFSRRDVLRLKQQLSRYHSVSVVYGNLSPEVRREEARRFREGETEVLVATDAIAMGLNLPIQTLYFSKADKFDGENQRELTPSEVHQISGRAGRYGMSEAGYVGALKPDVLRSIIRLYPKEDHRITVPFRVMANLDHIRLVGGILEERSLAVILEFFVKNMKFDGPFRATNLEGMLEAAAIVDRYDLDLATKFQLATAPLTTSSPYLMQVYERYVRLLEAKQTISYVPPRNIQEYAVTMEELLEAEDRVKEISLYLWLSYRFSDSFVDVESARSTRTLLNRFIENSLKQSHFVPRCRECSKPLPYNSEFAICQSCFRRLHRTPAPKPPYRKKES